MKRPSLLGLAALAGAAVLILPACGSTLDPNAATVTVQLERDGETVTRTGHITRSEFEDFLEGFTDSDSFLASFPAQNREGVITSSFASQQLSQLVIFEIVNLAFGRQELDVTPDIEAEARRLTQAQFDQQLPGVWEEFSTSFQDRLVRQNAELLALRLDIGDVGSLDDDAVRAYFDEHAEELARHCLSHILLESEEDAEAALARLEDGEAFADVAQELSTDTGSGSRGGELGCFTEAEAAEQLIPEFVEPAFDGDVDEIVGPVETQFGFHLITTTSIDDEFDPDAVRAAMISSTDEAFNEYIERVLDGLEVEVNRRYGTWNQAAFTVEPPQGAVQPTVTIPVARDDGESTSGS